MDKCPNLGKNNNRENGKSAAAIENGAKSRTETNAKERKNKKKKKKRSQGKGNKRIIGICEKLLFLFGRVLNMFIVQARFVDTFQNNKFC
ncbi:hypothetical protein POVCU2_0008240 [Plasmodium ovale curtisi]|uniref:Uncharacterized protein n=1 Tax=Plasmodium ovale curtisi TaxID=864141 RepID=A0A1A8VQI5_PLAOA|nr:hypothetical protein POVCU2_0008240 [Plasmodium ovale curtisi]